MRPKERDELALYRLGILMTVGAALLWSSGGLGIRLVQAGPWPIVFWRSLFMALTVFVYVSARERMRTWQAFRRIGWEGLAVGACLAGAFTFYVMAITHTAVANALIFQGMAPFFAALFGWLFLRERVPGFSFVLIAIAVSGVVVMFSGSLGSIMVVGDLFGLGVAFALSASIVIVRATRKVNMVPAAFVGAVLSALIALVASGGVAVALPDMLILALLGIFQLGLAFCLFLSGSRYLPPAGSGLITLLETVVGPVLVWLIIQEVPTLNAIVGGVVIVTALAVHSLVAPRRTRPL